MFKLKKRKRKEIYNIAKTATWDVLCSLDYTEKAEKKYPEHLYTNGRMRLLIGNFEGSEEAYAFIRMFKKFVADFEENVKRDNGRMIYVFEYDPKE